MNQPQMNTDGHRCGTDGNTGSRLGSNAFLHCLGIWSAVLYLSFSENFAQAQFVDVTAQIRIDKWGTHDEGFRTIHVVVGTNRWRMDGDLCGNCDMTYWFTGNSIISHSKVTKLPPDTDELGLSEEEKQQMIGRESTYLYDCPDGNPSVPRGGPGSDRMDELARIAWLAFCSGPYLSRDQRQVFPPSDLWKELIRANAFNDLTASFNDSFALPKWLELYATNSPNVQPIFKYRVLSSTNVLGWHFPLEFKMAQYRPAMLPGRHGIIGLTNGWELEFTATGKVTAIAPGVEPRVPPQVLKAAGN